MISMFRTLALRGIPSVVCCLALVATMAHAKDSFGTPEVHIRSSVSTLANPAIPDPVEFPFQFVLDDDSTEGSIGVGLPLAQQFLWFNRFTPSDLRSRIDEIWVLFPDDANIPVGGAIQLIVYADADGDPTSGAEILASYDRTVQIADGSTFSIYPIEPELFLFDPGDILIGVVPRFIESGVDPAVAPAAIDTSASQQRSWLATWSGDPPAQPDLPPDGNLVLIDVFAPGNFMIRAFGKPLEVIVIPTLGSMGFLLLVTLLAICGLTMSGVGRRRRRQE